MSRRGAGVGAVPASRRCAATRSTGEGLDAALDGVDVAYYLIHSMEPSADGAVRRSASDGRPRTSSPPPRAAGVERIVYLGGLVPAGGVPRCTSSSRLAVEQILLESMPARSRSAPRS